MTFINRLNEKVTADLQPLTQEPSTGHHNEANITLSEAIDSFMHFLLKKDGAVDAATETQNYVAQHKIPAETVRAYHRALSQYVQSITPESDPQVKEEPNTDEAAPEETK